MATSIGAFEKQLDTLLGDADTELSHDKRKDMIAAAVERYSHDAPEQTTEDVTGDGGRYYAITNLTSWVDGFSRIVRIQYPAPTIASDETPVDLGPDDWDDDYRDGSNNAYLWLPHHAPAATETMRITYTVPYTLSSGGYDTPASDFYAICHLAASFACSAIATKYARSNEPSITADSVDHGGRSERFRQMAREFMRLYLAHMDLSTDGDGQRETAAGEFVDWDTAPSWPRNRRWLFHGNR